MRKLVEYFCNQKKFQVIYYREIFYKNTKNIYAAIILDEAKKKRKKKRVSRHFTEGWVEFESKKAAKLVAEKLNNTPIATRKSSKFYDILWSIKYLPRFKWVHLSERLTYENAVKRQKMRTEISQARKEATFFQDNLDKSERIKKIKKQVKKSNKNKNKDISA